MPPFRSIAQMRYLYARHPEIAKEFAEHTPDFSKLPEHVKKRKATGGRIERERSLI